MRGRNMLITGLLMAAAVVIYLYYQDMKKNDALKPVISDAIVECKYNLAFLNRCKAKIPDSGNETAAMTMALGGEKVQLKARAINDLIRAGVKGKKRKVLEEMSEKTDNYNAKLAYLFYITGGPGNVSMSGGGNAPTTEEMIKGFSELSQILGK